MGTPQVSLFLKSDHIASMDQISLPSHPWILPLFPSLLAASPLVFRFFLLGLSVTQAHPPFRNTVHSRLDTAAPSCTILSVPSEATPPPCRNPAGTVPSLVGLLSPPSFFSVVPHQTFSKCGPWVSSISLTWQPVRDQTHQVGNSGDEPGSVFFIGLPGASGNLDLCSASLSS